MTPLQTLATVAIAVGFVAVVWLLWIWLRGRRHMAASAQDAYTQALSALIGGDRREALARLKDAIQEDSENLDAYIRLGDLLRENGAVQKALTVHRDLTVRSRLNDIDRARILESLTQDYLVAGRFEEAGQSAERLKHIDNKNLFAFRALQQVAESLKDWPRAIRVVEERARLENQKDKSMLARYRGYVGSQELEAGNEKEARQHFEEALKLDPGCLLASLYLGDMEHSGGNTAKAVEYWQSVALTAPERGGLVFDRLERAFFEMGHYADVMSFYRELLHRAPREASVPGLLALAEIHRRKGDLDDAESFVQEAMEIEPDHPRAHRHLIKLAMDRNNPQDALSHLDRLLQSIPAQTETQCRHCEAPIEEHMWRCPECKGLDPMGI